MEGLLLEAICEGKGERSRVQGPSRRFNTPMTLAKSYKEIGTRAFVFVIVVGSFFCSKLQKVLFCYVFRKRTVS
jgi:hypothetical protein